MSATLTIGGVTYQRWQSVRVTRGLKRGCSDFEFTAPCELTPPVLPFAACTITEAGSAVLTGYVDDVRPEIEARSSKTVITGRSKICDLIDCMPEFIPQTNQFNGYTLDAIARALGQGFGINVVLSSGVDVGDPFPDATFERSETCWAFLERLARQRAVLLTDDEKGNLVLATVGTANAPGNLLQGQGGNVFRARGDLSGKERFSEYHIRSQAGKKATGGKVQPAIKAIAYDGGVTRYRPWGGIAESAILTADAQTRANWEASHRSGQAVKATLSVPEWRANGTLWETNQLAQCTVPRLGLNDKFLIGEVDYKEDERQGRYVELQVSPPSAFVPGELKEKGKKTTGTGAAWAGIVNVQ